MLYLNHHKTNLQKEHPRMASITQDMKYRLSLIKYAERCGVTKVLSNPVVFWVKLMKRGYTRSIPSLYRFLRKQGLITIIPDICIISRI